MKNFQFFLFLITTICFWSTSFPILAQSYFGAQERNKKSIRIGFYNLENFFDLQDDSLTLDNEFLPYGIKSWDSLRYRQKLQNTFQVIAGIGGWEPPAILGFCELENGYILYDIIKATPLNKYDYRYIHFESPDRRGIDVGLAYRPSKFHPIHKNAIRVNFPFDTNTTTRDILHVKGTVLNKDTLHLFINHWPSRWGGKLSSAPKRYHAAKILKAHIDSVIKINPNAQIIIMGDFNDDPSGKSLKEVLKAKNQNDSLKNNKGLVNLMYEKKSIGTLKYKGQWFLFDQIVVSSNLMENKSGLKVKNNQAKVFRPDWLLTEDKKALGLRPFRTYRGYIYEGGFSDHLPVYLDLMMNFE